MDVIELPIADLHFDPANARRHPERNLASIKASLARFGQQTPIVIDSKNVVRKGNGTLAAAKELGWEAIQCVKTDLAGVDATAYAVADNRTGELAEWDQTVLAETLEALRSEPEFDLGDVGFTSDEVDALLEGITSGLAGPLEGGEDAGPQMDRAGEVQEKWKVSPGDLWEIPSLTVSGKCHRLLCGDSTKAEDVARVMGAEKAVLMNTDPPYGIGYDVQANYDAANAADGTQRVSRYSAIENDKLEGEELQTFLESCIRTAVPHLTLNAAFYLWHPMLTQGTFFAAAAAADILIHRQIIWVKPHFIFGRGDYHWKHELAFYGWVKGNRPPFYGERNQDTVWEFAIGHEKDHPTEKPVELFTRPINNHTKPGEAVYEPFSGSGSQFVAAEQTGRLCRGIELAPKYVSVALERLATLGLEPRKIA